MSYYPKHQQNQQQPQQRRSQQGQDRNLSVSPGSQRIYRPKNQVSPMHPDLSSSPLSPPTGRSPRSPMSSSWNSTPDYLSSSAPGRQPSFPSSSPSGPSFSSSYTNHGEHMQRHQNNQNNNQNRGNNNNLSQQQKNNSKPRSQSFGTGANQTVSYMRKLTLDDIRKFCEKTQNSFWSGEPQPPQSSESEENVGSKRTVQEGEWRRDLAIEISSNVPQKVAEVKVKKNSLRGKTFIVFEGEPEEKASSLWLALPHKVSSIRTYQEGEEYFTKAATYILRRMKAYLKDKGGVSAINYKLIIESKETGDNSISDTEQHIDLNSSKDSNDADQEGGDDKKTNGNNHTSNESFLIVFVVAYQ